MNEVPSFDFLTLRPQPPLDRFVESIWSVRGSSGYRRFTMLPNNAAQLMVNFGAPHAVLSVGGRQVGQTHRRAWFAGLQDGPLSLESPASSDLVAVRFRPGGAHAFLRVPLEAVTNDVVDAECLFGPAARDLCELLAAADATDRRLAVVERWLLCRLQPREFDFELVQRAVTALTAGGGSVRETSERLGLGHERAIRLFRRIAGLPPKSLAGVHRFRRALGLLAGGGVAHGEIALQLGYFDQAHFNREFRRFAGVSPGEFVRRRGADDESLVDG